jgi:hypothetical protein
MGCLFLGLNLLGDIDHPSALHRAKGDRDEWIQHFENLCTERQNLEIGEVPSNGLK